MGSGGRTCNGRRWLMRPAQGLSCVPRNRLTVPTPGSDRRMYGTPRSRGGAVQSRDPRWPPRRSRQDTDDLGRPRVGPSSSTWPAYPSTP